MQKELKELRIIIIVYFCLFAIFVAVLNYRTQKLIWNAEACNLMYHTPNKYEVYWKINQDKGEIDCSWNYHKQPQFIIKNID